MTCRAAHGALCLPHAHWNSGWPLLAGAYSPKLRTVRRGMESWAAPHPPGCVASAQGKGLCGQTRERH